MQPVFRVPCVKGNIFNYMENIPASICALSGKVKKNNFSKKLSKLPAEEKTFFGWVMPLFYHKCKHTKNDYYPWKKKSATYIKMDKMYRK